MKISKEDLQSNFAEILKLKKFLATDEFYKREISVDKSEVEVSKTNLLEEEFKLVKFYFRSLIIIDYTIDILIHVLCNVYFYYKQEESGEFFFNFANTFLIFSILIKLKVFLVEEYEYSLLEFVERVKQELYFDFCKKNKLVNKELVKINKKFNFELILTFYELNKSKERFLDLKAQINYYFENNKDCNFLFCFEKACNGLNIEGCIADIKLNDSFDVNYVFSTVINELNNLNLQQDIIKTMNTFLNNSVTDKIMDYGLKFVYKNEQERIVPFLKFKNINVFENTDIDNISYNLYLNLAKFLLSSNFLFRQNFKEDLNARFYIKMPKLKRYNEDFVEYTINEKFPFFSSATGAFFNDYLILNNPDLIKYYDLRNEIYLNETG
jgi:hypothetical protein